MVEVGGLPSNDKLPVRRCSQRLGEDTAVCAHTCLIGAQVVIVREQGIEERTALIRVYRHALLPVEQLVSGRGGQLNVAVGPGIRY
jgi:predicted ABC-type sugar transport system permease subunit